MLGSVRLFLLVGVMTTLAGCCPELFVPDQGSFDSLEALSESGLAVVRLYGAPLPFVEFIAKELLIHTISFVFAVSSF